MGVLLKLKLKILEAMDGGACDSSQAPEGLYVMFSNQVEQELSGLGDWVNYSFHIVTNLTL